MALPSDRAKFKRNNREANKMTEPKTRLGKKLEERGPVVKKVKKQGKK